MMFITRPPIWSVHTPSSTRDSDPVRIGMPASNPSSVSLKPRSCWILTPMIEKIVHTAKHTVNAKVLIQSAAFCCPRWTPPRSAIATPKSRFRRMPLRLFGARVW